MLYMLIMSITFIDVSWLNDNIQHNYGYGLMYACMYICEV